MEQIRQRQTARMRQQQPHAAIRPKRDKNYRQARNNENAEQVRQRRDSKLDTQQQQDVGLSKRQTQNERRDTDNGKPAGRQQTKLHDISGQNIARQQRGVRAT